MAFSGGGDSLALLLGAKAWADRHGRRLTAVTVDHRLRPEGADWAQWCRHRALRLGVDHESLVWDDDKPATGLAATARRARHGLLADAARRTGAAVILMGHTADDRSEAAAMRAAGASTPTPRIWAPSPVWPRGRGLFVFRPLLATRRSDLRAVLTELGESWIEDPANHDPRSLRARIRASAAADAYEAVPALDITPDQVGVREGPAADLTLALTALLRSTDPVSTLAAALLCAAGTDRPPRRLAVERVLTRAREATPFTTTLAGARIVREGDGLHIARDAADQRRGTREDLALEPGIAQVWDGRFEVRTGEGGARIGFLTGRAATLPTALRAAVASIPVSARRALPLVTHADGALDCPSLVPSRRIQATSLALPRLLAARGWIIDEAALRRMAKRVGRS